MYEITNRTLQVLNPIKIKHSTTYGSPSYKRTVTIRCTHRYAAVSFNCVTYLPVKVATASDENYKLYGPRERTVEQRGLANFEIPVS